MVRIPFALLMSLFLFAPCGVMAQTLWLCVLSEDAVRLVCVAETDPLDDPLRVGDAAPVPQTIVRGTAFPLDPRRQYSIDLWSPPTEMDFVEQLAQASLCHRSTACRAVVAGERWPAYSGPAVTAVTAGLMARRR
jgi:hypothetical protein